MKKCHAFEKRFQGPHNYDQVTQRIYIFTNSTFRNETPHSTNSYSKRSYYKPPSTLLQTTTHTYQQFPPLGPTTASCTPHPSIQERPETSPQARIWNPTNYPHNVYFLLPSIPRLATLTLHPTALRLVPRRSLDLFLRFPFLVTLRSADHLTLHRRRLRYAQRRAAASARILWRRAAELQAETGRAKEREEVRGKGGRAHGVVSRAHAAE